MINRDCYGPLSGGECYGSLGQDIGLQNNIFNDINGAYYLPDGIYNDLMYGQPILKVNGTYAVFLFRYRERYVDWNVFGNIENNQYRIEVKNKNLDDEVQGYKRDSKKYFDWIYGGKPNPTIYYPGLQGVKLNQDGADYSKNDNPFNPKSGGSNFDDSLITPNYNW